MFVSSRLRPIVGPGIPDADAAKSTEIRCVAPGNLTSNLDFVESIFGNGGNPNLTEFDAALDVRHWTGHSGYVPPTPQLTRFTRNALGISTSVMPVNVNAGMACTGRAAMKCTTTLRVSRSACATNTA